MTTFGVIGTGSMGSMLVRKMVESGQAGAHEIIVYNRSAEKALRLVGATGVRIAPSARDVAEQSDVSSSASGRGGAGRSPYRGWKPLPHYTAQQKGSMKPLRANRPP